MQDVLTLPGGETWYLLEDQGEASAEGFALASDTGLAFTRETGNVARRYREATHPALRTPAGEERYIERHRPLFLALRDGQGRTLAGGMLPRGDGPGAPTFVARGNHDPYVEHAAALVELGKLYGFDLRDGRAYPAGYPYDSLRGKAPPPVDAPSLSRIDPALV